MWQVYILKCADGSLYTGITTDIGRRLKEHNGSRLGAKYTKVRRPVKLAYVQALPDRSQAAREEYRLKQLSRAEKLALIKKAGRFGARPTNQ